MDENQEETQPTDAGLVPEPTPVVVFEPLGADFGRREFQLNFNKRKRVGRAMAKIKPAPTNAIFENQVLSRNHAEIWWDHRTGQLMIRDTKSSNGTYLNNMRLSKSGEESDPVPISHGATLQLGEDADEHSGPRFRCVKARVLIHWPNASHVDTPPPTPPTSTLSESPSSASPVHIDNTEAQTLASQPPSTAITLSPLVDRSREDPAREELTKLQHQLAQAKREHEQLLAESDGAGKMRIGDGEEDRALASVYDTIKVGSNQADSLNKTLQLLSEALTALETNAYASPKEWLADTAGPSAHAERETYDRQIQALQEEEEKLEARRQTALNTRAQFAAKVSELEANRKAIAALETGLAECRKQIEISMGQEAQIAEASQRLQQLNAELDRLLGQMDQVSSFPSPCDVSLFTPPSVLAYL
eukprot:comp21946_c2_seq1/m.31630 comp21946_c2_seq1/g.31630  ORF comp21946_c2_seq1/g.31630 comp21946_c2_seq1/m.31630 type:complete len:418 (-) comp21946_c2_seq1:159-1412(-)